SGYDVDGTDQTSLGQFSGRVQQTYKHSVPRFFVPEHGTMFTLALVRLLKTKLSLLPKKLFRIRMSRNFGMKMLTMTNLSTECLIQLTKLGYDATPFNQILKQNAKREMRLRLGKVTVADVLAAQPVTTN